VLASNENTAAQAYRLSETVAGLQFLDATDEFRARLDACIEALGE
jgi:hypothetical protein